MMEVELIYYTPKELLIYAKNTRLDMANSWEKILAMTEDEKQNEIKYIFGTIRSCLEFVDYVFLIKNVTRAFTHQLVRHRVGFSFAQQSQRAIDMSGFEVLATNKTANNEAFKKAVDCIRECYKSMITSGIPPQDARGILPTNTLTNILVKANLRAISDMLKIRLCKRTQGEFQSVAIAIRNSILDVHPWAEPLLVPHCVANEGRCAFSNTTDCPLKINGLVKSEPELKEKIKKKFNEINLEINPFKGRKNDAK